MVAASMVNNSQLISQLRAANQELQQLNQILLDRVAFTGHEWRNQVAKLQVTAEILLRETEKGSRQADMISSIKEAAFSLNCIAENYLQLSRITGQTFQIKPRYVDLRREVIEPVCKSYADRLNMTGQTCEYQPVWPEDDLVWADKELLVTIYDNLLNNAIKYGKQGGRIIFWWANRGRMHELSVWNSGPGVPPDRLDEILNRFVSTSEPMVDAGTNGIGLYLVSKIMEAHQGRLWVESRPGSWANFIMALPSREWGVRAPRTAQSPSADEARS